MLRSSCLLISTIALLVTGYELARASILNEQTNDVCSFTNFNTNLPFLSMHIDSMEVLARFSSPSAFEPYAKAFSGPDASSQRREAGN